MYNFYKCKCGKEYNNSQSYNGHCCHCIVHRNGMPWIVKRRPYSEERKKELSMKLKKIHADGKHPGWSHINKNKNRRSKAEELFYNWIKCDTFLKTLKIEEKWPIGKYVLDFAILDYKCDIEIDGIQHIRSADAINHDIIRDQFMLDNDWKVYRINVGEFYKNKQCTIDVLKIWLLSKEKLHTYDIEQLNLKNNKRSRKQYIIDYKNERINKNKHLIYDILNSNIDFSKYGWSKQVCELIKIYNAKQWMIKYMPEFYENKCFKKK